MAKISVELDALIAEQETEITRMREQHLTNLTAANTRLALLKGARAKVTPDLDATVDALRAAGIWPGR